MVISQEVDVQADARNVAKVFQKSDGNCRAAFCETVDKLSDILNTDNFQKLMKKFGEKCGCKSKCRRFDAFASERTLSILGPRL